MYCERYSANTDNHMYTPGLARTQDEFQQIALLSGANQRTVLSEAYKQSQGFLTWLYTTDMLEEMTRIAPSVIVKAGDEVAGYALTALKETAAIQPELGHTLAHVETLSWKNRPVTGYGYYYMGQICIAHDHRGKGIFDMLYRHHKTVFQPQFELLVTEISASNHRSMKAHLNTGFEIINTHRDHLDEWVVVAWDWT